MVVDGAERNTTPDAMMSIYSVVHAMGKTQLGGVRGDWFKDLYHREEAEAFGEADADTEFIV
jgi:hypothetical protein